MDGVTQEAVALGANNDLSPGVGGTQSPPSAVNVTVPTQVEPCPEPEPASEAEAFSVTTPQGVAEEPPLNELLDEALTPGPELEDEPVEMPRLLVISREMIYPNEG